MHDRIFDKVSLCAGFLLGVLLKNGRLEAPMSAATVAVMQAAPAPRSQHR